MQLENLSNPAINPHTGQEVGTCSTEGGGNSLLRSGIPVLKNSHLSLPPILVQDYKVSLCMHVISISNTAVQNV